MSSAEWAEWVRTGRGYMPGVGVRPAGGYVGPLHPWLTPIDTGRIPYLDCTTTILQAVLVCRRKNRGKKENRDAVDATPSPPRRRRRGACTKIRTRYYSSVSTCIYFSMCGCQMASPSAMQPVPMTNRICCGRSSVRNGTAKPAMKLPIIEWAVSSAALQR